METAQIQRNVDALSQDTAEVCVSIDEFVCANCGYGATSRDGYAYHIKLCAIPAQEEAGLTPAISESTDRDGQSFLKPISAGTSDPVLALSSGCWSRLRRAVRAIVENFGRYGPNGDYYLIQNAEENGTQSKAENPWPPANTGKTHALLADPYGLIYRWKVRQENGGSESPSLTNARQRFQVFRRDVSQTKRPIAKLRD